MQVLQGQGWPPSPCLPVLTIHEVECMCAPRKWNGGVFGGERERQRIVKGCQRFFGIKTVYHSTSQGVYSGAYCSNLLPSCSTT
eukprot:3591225-Rhodomonas_salina.1